MSFRKLTAIFAVDAFTVPKVADWNPETFAAVKQQVAENHGVIVKEAGADGESLTLAFIGDNGKFVVRTGQTIVFDSNDSTIEVYENPEALGQYYVDSPITE